MFELLFNEVLYVYALIADAERVSEHKKEPLVKSSPNCLLVVLNAKRQPVSSLPF